MCHHVVYGICDNYKVVHKRNPISGHTWIEHEQKKGFHVTGGFLMERQFRSREKALEAIHFDIKFNLPNGWTHEIKGADA